MWRSKGNGLREPRAAGQCKCAHCGVTFTAWRVTAEYCSEKCRHASWRRRRGAAERSDPLIPAPERVLA